MRPFLFLVACCLILPSVPAQVTLLNAASNPPSVFQSTVGPDISVDPGFFQLNGGSALRGYSPSNQSYLPTGIALDPTQGFTMQWWYRPARPTGFGYLIGDADMVSPLAGYSGGRFRVFQNGACYCPTYTPANTGGLTCRGVPNEAALLGSPLTNAINLNGFVHLALRYDPAASTIDWLVNGVVSSSTPQVAGPFTWQGTNLDIMGDRGSSADAGDGHYDDFRIYGFARSDVDIMADFMIAAGGVGPSGQPNVPDIAYYQADLSLEPHFCYVGTNSDPIGTTARRITSGTLLEWGGNSPNQPGTPAACLINVWPGGVDPGCTTVGFPNLGVCHAFSAPAGQALIFPDGLGLGPVGVGLGVTLPYQYSGGPQGMTNTLTASLPPSLLTAGDELVLQFVAPDGAYPSQTGTSNLMRLPWVDPIPGPHARIAVRGNASIQILGFFRVLNTGDEAITQVIFDASPLGANTGFAPSCGLNTGGSLALGTSYRFGTDVTSGLILGTNNGWTGLGMFAYNCLGALPGSGNGYSGLQFDFSGFTATVDEFVFDSGTVAPNVNANYFIGMNISVTFSSGVTLSGALVADPNDPDAAIIDL
ncbi:MAG: hypothetical protein CMJ83_19400 [Planctomycetes bacterium]|nr:hypothetical protein [Planctomycetota bacterium]